MKQKTGARGLRSIIEETLLDVMYELPSMKGVIRCVVEAEAIRGDADVEVYTQSGEITPLPTFEQKTA